MYTHGVDSSQCMAKPIQYCKVKKNNKNNKIKKKPSDSSQCMAKPIQYCKVKKNNKNNKIKKKPSSAS